MPSNDNVILLDEWQREALEHDGHLLLKTGRQVGKTTILSIKAAEYMIKNKGAKIIVCSLTEDQAQLMIIMVLDYLQKKYRQWIAKGQKNQTKNKIVLNNKSQIIARPVGTTGDALRGFTGDVLILDEVSRFSELIMVAAKPTLMTTGGQVWMASTPFGKQGFFYEAYLNKNNRYKVIEADSWSVIHNRPISETWTETKKSEAIKYLEEEKKEMTALQFGQEYMGLFVEDLLQFFPDALIQELQILDRQEPDHSQEYYLGCDVGGLGGDLTTLEIGKRVKNKMYQVENITLQFTYTTQVTDEILRQKVKWKTKKEYIDDMGIGFGVFSELLNNSLTRNSVEAINNSKRKIERDRVINNQLKTGREKGILKEDLYFNLKRLMERKEIFFLKDENIFQSLKSVQLEVADGGKIKFFGKDTHIAEGLIRMAWAMQKKELNIWCY